MTTLSLRKVKTSRIFEQAVSQIRELIAEGVFAPGERLPTEQQLSERLEVSRASIREALRVLEAEGLILVRRGLGAYVASRPPSRIMSSDLLAWLEQREEAIEQILEVRAAVEGMAAALVASRASPEKLAEIRSIFDTQSLAITQSCGEENELDRVVNLDEAFHLAISEASGNDIANQVISHIIPVFASSNKVFLYVCKQVTKMQEEHRDILAALEARDPVAAENAMRNHIQRVQEDMKRALKSPS